MQKINKNTTDNLTRVARNKRIFITVLASMLAAVLVLSAAVGVIYTVRDGRAVVKYNGVRIDRGVAAYLAATYKASFMASVGEAYDTPEFWESKPFGTDKTYGELLESATLDYVKSVAVGAYLFDRYSSLTSEECAAIETACAEVLDYKANNDASEFNRAAEAMGFSYSDFEKATELMYKSELAKTRIYGSGGEALATNAGLTSCNEYYMAEYHHVKLLFIPTKLKILTDSAGAPTMTGGVYDTEYFTAAELIERCGDIEEIRRLIDGYVNDLDEQISPEYFDLMQAKYNISHAKDDTGYYFSKNSAFTQNFATDSSAYLPEDYSLALYKALDAAVASLPGMNVGEYREIEGDFGSLFIYKYENADLEYLLGASDAQFHDFYSDAADYLYVSQLEELVKDVSVRDGYSDIDTTAVPYNVDFVAKIG